jgi:hypothetical protein
MQAGAVARGLPGITGMTSRRLEELLVRLGDTAEAVAATLRAHNVKGARNTIRHLNPIIRFIQPRLQIDDYNLALVRHDSMPAPVLRMALPNGTTEQVALPTSVKDFLDLFNEGRFPDMELS